MYRSLCLSAVLLLACKNDIVLDQTNFAPSSSIQSPEDGSVYQTGETIELQGLIGDSNGQEDIANFSWISNIDGVFAEPPAVELDAQGITRWAGALSVGNHTITLRATDLAGESAEDAVSLVVEVGNTHPIAEISSPMDFDTFEGGTTIDFFAVVGDPNQSPETLTAVWTVVDQNTNATVLEQDSPPGLTGATTARLLDAPLGSYLATITITDDDGNEASDSVVFGVSDPGDADADGDGFSLNQGDCDDNDALRYPTAPESCDLIDNDCNGVIDDKDDDSDLHIDENCGAYTGALPVDDCDDGNALVNPTSPEIDDGLDNDCNGSVDDGTLSWDADGDCWCIGPTCVGSENPACVMVLPGDCNDTDPALNLDDVDSDGYSTCEGDCDDSDPAASPADSDSDGFSSCQGDCDDSDATLTPADVDGDTFSTCAGDCDDVPLGCGADCFPGNPVIDDCDGRDQDCDQAIDEDATLVWYHDADGDGATSLTDTVTACADPDGAGTEWVATPTAADCDDQNPLLNLDDADGDGFSSCEQDCDDSEPTTFPGAVELCDGIDNNCVDGVDDSPDDDADGFAVCDGDCDDGEPTTFPGAPDVPDPNYIDSDCDGIDGELANDVFVDASTGNDGNSGDASAPLATIQAGISAAGTTRNVLVATNQPYTISGSLLVSNGVSVYGGYNGADWSRSAAKARVNAGTTGMIATSVNSVTEIAQLDIRGSSNTTTGGTAYGARVLDSSGLLLTDTRIESGNGGPGAPGATGSPGQDGSTGGAAQNGCDGCSGNGFGGVGGNGGGTCPDGGDGGRGGYGDSDGESGDPGEGLIPGSGGTPGTEGTGTCVFGCNNAGAGGAGGVALVPGGPGIDGFGGNASGGVLTDLWFGQNGGDGSIGECGSGGGGGGGGGGNDCCNDDRGGGGGAGGGAGQGGGPGGGGTAGGGSIALFLARSTITLDGAELVSGSGGPGGSGGTGGPAGDGASGRSGGGPADDAAAGGVGGAGSSGGRGGHGGGGAGGVSYGIYKVSSSRNIGPGGVTYTVGGGGPGGVAPLSILNGASGSSGQEF